MGDDDNCGISVTEEVEDDDSDCDEINSEEEEVEADNSGLRVTEEVEDDDNDSDEIDSEEEEVEEDEASVSGTDMTETNDVQRDDSSDDGDSLAEESHQQKSDEGVNGDLVRLEETYGRNTLSGQRTTEAQALLLILAYTVSAGLSWEQIDGLLRLINALFGQIVAPKSKFLFRKIWKRSHSDMVDFHFFVKNATTYQQCTRCHTSRWKQNAIDAICPQTPRHSFQRDRSS